MKNPITDYAELLEPGRGGSACPARAAVNLVAFFQKKAGKVGAILASNAGNECTLGQIPPLEFRSALFSSAGKRLLWVFNRPPALPPVMGCRAGYDAVSE